MYKQISVTSDYLNRNTCNTEKCFGHELMNINRDAHYAHVVAHTSKVGINSLAERRRQQVASKVTITPYHQTTQPQLKLRSVHTIPKPMSVPN
jgi:hypothetical protein